MPMNPRWRLRIVPGLVILLSAATTRADVKLHGLFSDHVVLQRDIAVPIWGWADDGEHISVEFRGHKVTTKAVGGRWLVRLPRLEAGGPDKLTVTGKNSISLDDVMVGEVWIASGQSNMEWPMRASYDAEHTTPRLCAWPPTTRRRAFPAPSGSTRRATATNIWSQSARRMRGGMTDKRQRSTVNSQQELPHSRPRYRVTGLLRRLVVLLNLLAD